MHIIAEYILYLRKLIKSTENIKQHSGTWAQGSGHQVSGLPIVRRYQYTLFPDKCVGLVHGRKRVGLWDSSCDEEMYRDQSTRKELITEMGRPWNKTMVAQIRPSSPPSPPGRTNPSGIQISAGHVRGIPTGIQVLDWSLLDVCLFWVRLLKIGFGTALQCAGPYTHYGEHAGHALPLETPAQSGGIDKCVIAMEYLS